VETSAVYDPYGLVKELFPIHRTIASPGTLRSLEIIRDNIPELQIKSVQSGTKIWDWTVPDEWSIDSAWIEDLQGRRIIDYSDSNLRVVGFSTPVDRLISHSELLKHLHFLEDVPTAIPYVTSYYSPNWGFCIRFEELKKLNSDTYRVVINSKFMKGSLNYGEVILHGKSKKEVLFSTNICHPSMANNELSGPAVLVGLVKFLKAQQNVPKKEFEKTKAALHCWGSSDLPWRQRKFLIHTNTKWRHVIRPSGKVHIGRLQRQVL
jgi:aminopeptidase-like protein